MTLLIDIGNSNICLGISKDYQILSSYRIKSYTNKSSDEYYILFKEFVTKEVDKIIISSVVPTITSPIKKMCLQYYKIEPIIVGKNTKTGIKLIADDPKTVGADLVCDVIGASLYANEGIIVDLGTASKFLYFKNKAFLGCTIAPGVSVSTKAMISSGAMLPNMELMVPEKVLNTSTIPCMQAGVLYGFASMVDGMIRKIKKEINNPNIKVIATGGLISLIGPLCQEKIDIIDSNLVLKGLIEIDKLNS